MVEASAELNRLRHKFSVLNSKMRNDFYHKIFRGKDLIGYADRMIAIADQFKNLALGVLESERQDAKNAEMNRVLTKHEEID